MKFVILRSTILDIIFTYWIILSILFLFVKGIGSLNIAIGSIFLILITLRWIIRRNWYLRLISFLSVIYSVILLFVVLLFIIFFTYPWYILFLFFIIITLNFVLAIISLKKSVRYKYLY